MACRHFTAEEEAQIVQWANSDMSRGEIARRLEREPSSIWNCIARLRAQGIAIKAGSRHAPRPKGVGNAPWNLRIQPTQRRCLCCQKAFLSEGAHNRLCVTCRGKSVDCFSAPSRVMR